MAEVAAHEHCLHELQRYTYRLGTEGFVHISSRCCHCGEVHMERLPTVPDSPAHGPFGFRVLRPSA